MNLLGIVLAASLTGLPNHHLTPGAANPTVTQDTIHETICVPGWTRIVRPPAEYTDALKRKQIRAYGYADRHLSDFEEDHLVPLVLGGAPRDPHNLWPEPRFGYWDAARKDDLEVELARLVCAGRLTLDEARAAISADWRAAWRR